MLPRSQEEVAGLAQKMLLRSSDDAVRIVLPEVSTTDTKRLFEIKLGSCYLR